MTERDIDELSRAIRRFDSIEINQLLEDPTVDVNSPANNLPLFEVVYNIFTPFLI